MAADSYEDIAVGKGDAIPSLEVKPQDLYHAKSFWTRWIFCQDAKVIGIQNHRTQPHHESDEPSMTAINSKIIIKKQRPIAIIQMETTHGSAHPSR